MGKQARPLVSPYGIHLMGMLHIVGKLWTKRVCMSLVPSMVVFGLAVQKFLNIE
jgi:hypothetical protein